jgi:pyridoxamine 5'-phosphate oxidase-like protein
LTSKPSAGRPSIPGYGIPTGREGMLRWDHVLKRMEETHYYWIGTVTRSATPHSVPVQGVWVDETLFFGGGSQTLWWRNFVTNPSVSVHLAETTL